MLHSEIKDRKAHKHSLLCKESTIFLTNDHHLLSYLFLPQPLLPTNTYPGENVPQRTMESKKIENEWNIK